MEFKICKKCKIEKSLEDFPKNKTFTSGRENRCKTCASEYYQINKDKIRKKQKEYDEINPRLIYRKKYRQNNKEKTRIKSKTRYQNDTKVQIIKENNYSILWDCGVSRYSFKEKNLPTYL